MSHSLASKSDQPTSKFRLLFSQFYMVMFTPNFIQATLMSFPFHILIRSGFGT